MLPLNYTGDIDEMSDEAVMLADNGVVILKCYRAMKAYHIKVNTRIPFDECLELVRWYVEQRFSGRIVASNIGDYVRNGDVLFTFVGRM